MAGPRDYSAGTRAALATLSRGHCYFPGCTEPTVVFVEGKPTVNLHIAHIRDAKEGNRYDPNMSDDERRAFDNLVLLCKPHHDLVDKIEPDNYTIEMLVEWKRERENSGVAELRGLSALTEDKLAEMIGEAIAQQAARPSLDWSLDEEAFEENLADVLRAGDDITLHRFFDTAKQDWRELIGTDARSSSGALQLLDRIACLAVLSIRWRRTEWARESAAVFEAMYSEVLTDHGSLRAQLVEPAPQLLLAIAARVLGIGAVAVGAEAWPLINDLTLRVPRHMPDAYTNWLQHASVTAVREGALEHTGPGGEKFRISYLNAALLEIGDVGCLNPAAPNREDITTRLAGFDALAALTSIAHPGETARRPYFPWHRALDNSRYEWAILLVLSNQNLRGVVFPAGDAELASALRLLEQLGHELRGYDEGGWPYEDRKIVEFLEEN